MQKLNRVNCALGLFTLTVVVCALPAYSQQATANPEMQQKVAALKQSLAENQQALHQYTWTEKMETIFKGETKSTKQWQCKYDPDGIVQKTALDSPQPPQRKRGVKGKVIEKKKGEMKDYMERVASLVKRYVPPEGSQMQASFQSGNGAMQPAADGVVTLVFHDYAKPGDTVSLKFDTAAKKIQGYDVSTYLDAPEEVVTLRVVFENLPDGTNYVAQSILDATAKQVQIRTTNSGYTKI